MPAPTERTTRAPSLRRLIPVILATGIACNDPTSGLVDTGRYVVPDETGDGWATGHVADFGFDQEPIEALIDGIEDGTYANVHAVLIAREGVLLLEQYVPGYTAQGTYVAFDRETLHTCYSVTKSVNAALIGMAIDDGAIPDVEQPISGYLPEYADIFTDPDKDRLRLHDLLTMSAGLEWDELTYPYGDPRNTHYGLRQSADPVRYTLEQPVVADPGARFAYNSGLSLALGKIVENAVGQRPDEYAERRLFAPLGIVDYAWGSWTGGTTLNTGGGLSLRPRDMAKFGQLYLNGGRWGDARIVSEAWVSESVRAHAPNPSYGYQWWRVRFDGDIDAYVGIGWGGQYVFVMPDLALVVVLTGGNYDESIRYAYDIVETHVLASLRPAP